MLLLCSTSFLLADLAPRDSFLITQPDGTTLWVYECGDEYYHWEESTDGYVIVPNDQGVMEYAIAVNEQLVSSGVKVHNVYEKKQVEKNYANRISQNANKVRRSAEFLARKRMTPRIITLPTSPVVGTREILTILVGFSDYSFTYTASDFDALMNEVGYSAGGNAGSVRDYYYENSYGQLTLQSTVIGPFIADSASAYYSRPMGGISNGEYHTPELVREAINYAISQNVDFGTFDGNNDGIVDCIHIVYAGNRYQVGSPGLIWPFHSHYDTTFVQNGYSISVSDFIMTPEKLGYTLSDITTIGTICHELGHVLGAPDFYPVGITGTTSHLGTGPWDLMADGDNAYMAGAYPAHHNPYTKTAIFQWTTPIMIDASKKNFVYNISTSSQNSNAIYKIPTSTGGEYYLLENRQKISFDRYLPDSGLLIYHIHGDIERAIPSNIVNLALPQKCYLVDPASNQALPTDTSSYGYVASNIFPYSSATAEPTSIFFTTQTTPSSLSWDSVPTGVDICFIQHDGNNMKFVVNPQIEGPTYLCDSTYYYVRNIPDGATIQWSGGMMWPYCYNIFGSTNSDSVLIKRGIPMIDYNDSTAIRGFNTINGFNSHIPDSPIVWDTTMTLEATISYAGKSYKLQKIAYASELGTPRIQVSDTSYLWKKNTSRTFTITNCEETPDSLLLWGIMKTDQIPELVHLSLGRTMTYMPTHTGIYEVTVTNVNKQCGTTSSSKNYKVVTKLNMKAIIIDGVVNVNIVNENDDILMPSSAESREYIMDLWHPIYGLVTSRKVWNNKEQINANGLPFGVYIILLKENGTIVAETKVLIR